MNRFVLAAILAVTAAASALAESSWLPPPDNARCPSKWGAGDERGAGNHMGPQSVLKATGLIRTGEVIELGHDLHAGMPLAAGRVYDMQVKRTAVGDAANRRNGNEELIIAEMGQVGTQLDGFAHQTIDNSHYNCFRTEDIATRTGFTKLGIEKVGMLMTRGVLIDVAGYKGVATLPDTYEITVSDLEGAIARDHIVFEPGDAIIVHTGWGRLWDREPARYGATNPGLGVKAAEFLLAKDPLLLGSDTAPVEVSPNPDKTISLPLHQLALVVHGVHLLENLKLDELALKGVREFAFVMQPLKLRGATGSTVAPAAIR